MVTDLGNRQVALAVRLLLIRESPLLNNVIANLLALNISTATYTLNSKCKKVVNAARTCRDNIIEGFVAFAPRKPLHQAGDNRSKRDIHG